MMQKLKKTIRLPLCILVYSMLPLSGCIAQTPSLKEQAMEAFKQEHYDAAITLLERAVKETPKDAEVYYYLGFFNHYRAYDSRPLAGYDYGYSQRIFEYLDQALQLNPNHGNAKYFYGAECSGNAFQAMQQYDVEKLRYFYKRAFEKGAYPEWLLEYGRNYLNSCEANAILFTAGNADFDVCSYLQLHEGYRTDITLTSIGMIDRPWYIKFLKNGLQDAVCKIDIKLTNNQIDDMHPYKWKPTPIHIPFAEELKSTYQLHSDHRMTWLVEPDYTSGRMHAKTSDEKAHHRTYLSPQRALLVQIIEDNFVKRPIYFSATANPVNYAGLEDFFQNCGLVYRLLPFETTNSKYADNIPQLEQLFQPDHLKYLSTVAKDNLPRVSKTLYVYHYALLHLADHYKHTHQNGKLNALRQFYTKYLLIGIQPEREQRILSVLQNDETWNKSDS